MDLQEDHLEGRLQEEDHHEEVDLGEEANPTEEAFRRKAEEAIRVFEVVLEIALVEAWIVSFDKVEEGNRQRTMVEVISSFGSSIGSSSSNLFYQLCLWRSSTGF